MSVELSPGRGRTFATDLPAPTIARSDDAVSSHAHTVQFYGDDAFLLDELSRFIGSALEAGDAGIVLATKAHLDGLTTRLQARGVDLNLAVSQGWYIAGDAAEILSRIMVDGWPDATRFTDLIGGIIGRASAAAIPSGEPPRIAIFGELVALLVADGKPEAAIRLEHLWNDLAQTHAFDLHCGYPLSAFPHEQDGGPLAEICAAHSRVTPTESYTTLINDDDRLRAITLLQQKAQALDPAIAERTRVQHSLQRRENELADFLNNALEGVLEIGADQVIRWANKAQLRLLGYAPEDYVGHPLGEFHVNEHVVAGFWRRLLCGEDIYDFPADLRCNDGSLKHVLIHANGLWEGDRFVHAQCFVRDITEHKRMEQTLRERNAQLRASIAARDEFLSVAAHELRTPVTSLRGFAQLLLRDARRQRAITPERLASALDAIERQTGKLNQLVARLLDTAQIEAGRLRINPVATDLVAIIRSALAQQYGAANHTLIFIGPAQLEAVADPLRFEQVITNLLDNAIKFSPDGGNVTVELGHDDHGGIRLSVTDQGVGIPPDKHEEIFDRFNQAPDERHLSGMGLGLAIIRQIIELHGGSVRIEDPEHPGARFVVSLPPSAAGTP